MSEQLCTIKERWVNGTGQSRLFTDQEWLTNRLGQSKTESDDTGQSSCSLIRSYWSGVTIKAKEWQFGPSKTRVWNEQLRTKKEVIHLHLSDDGRLRVSHQSDEQKNQNTNKQKQWGACCRHMHSKDLMAVKKQQTKQKLPSLKVQNSTTVMNQKTVCITTKYNRDSPRKNISAGTIKNKKISAVTRPTIHQLLLVSPVSWKVVWWRSQPVWSRPCWDAWVQGLKQSQQS